MRPRLACEKCGDSIGLDDRQYVADQPTDQPRARVWHFQCAPLDESFHLNGEEFNTWCIAKLHAESIALRHRTEILLHEVIDILRKQGVDDTVIEDVRKTFGFYDPE